MYRLMEVEVRASLVSFHSPVRMETVNRCWGCACRGSRSGQASERGRGFGSCVGWFGNKVRILF